MSYERRRLPTDPICLDVGAGYGTMSIWLAERFPEGEVFADDLDQAAFAVNDLPNLRFEAVDVSTADLGEGSSAPTGVRRADPNENRRCVSVTDSALCR